MFLEMYLKIIVTIIVDSETSKSLAKQAHLSKFSSLKFAQSSIWLVGFQFRWLKIKGIEAAFPIYIIAYF